MMINEVTFPVIVEKNVSAIQALHYSEEARPHYDMLGDMVYWEDEVPDGPFDLVCCVRIVLRARQQRALADKNALAYYWSAFLSRVPSWPGFRAERCDTARLRALYEELWVPVELPPE